ncbi:MAG: cell envelope integrity protein TolA [Pseudomonadota bacterium]|nr:cell envelope integrity protein TolA [Pseudomonadota bacterium]
MANVIYPDYGPIKELSQFAQDGFAQGSFLFQLFAGEVSGSMALHYVGLTFALIGAASILLYKKFHNVKTIGCWSFLVLALLIAPKGAEVTEAGVENKRKSNFIFTSIPTNNSRNPGLISYVDGFTPQVVVIDLMSKIHKAIFLGFFNISDPTNPTARNFIADLTNSQANKMDIALAEREDIKTQISAYTHYCGPASDLALPLFSPEYAASGNPTQTYEVKANEYLRTNNFHANTQVSSYVHPLDKTLELQRTLFISQALKSLLENHVAGYGKSPGLSYPPFALAFDDEDHLKTAMAQSGVNTETMDLALKFYNKDSLAEDIAKNEVRHFLVSHSYAVQQINAGTTLKSIGTAPTNGLAAFSFEVVNDNAFTEDSSQIAQGIKIFPDPIELRLRGSDKAATISQEEGGFWKFRKDSLWYDYIEDEGLGGVPLQLGFITPALTEVYKARANEATDRIKNLNDRPVAHVVTTCAQLHTLTHNHIRDAILFQSSWPGHPNTLTSSDQASFGQKLDFNDKDGFEPIVTNTRPIESYPYKPSDTLSSEMLEANRALQIRLQEFNFANQRNMLRKGDATTEVAKIAAESLRLGLTASMVLNAINNSAFYISRDNSEGRAQQETINQLGGGTDDLSEAIRTTTTSDSMSKRMPNLVPNAFRDAITWIGEVGSAVIAQFQGVGAVAFVRFLQLFTAVALFFVIMCTPILFMMGIVIPAHAPGVILTSIAAVLTLKAIPIGFTLVDAVLANAVESYAHLGFMEMDYVMMLYVAAAAYTSVTAVTLFLLFKAGDTKAVIGQMAQLDSKANEVAETAAKAAKGIAIAAGAAATAGAGGAIGSAVTTKSFGKAAMTGLSQAGEVFGKKGLQSIPGVGGMVSEVGNSYREGKAEGNVRMEVDASNADLDREIQNKQKMLDSGTLNPEESSKVSQEIDDLKSKRKSYKQHLWANADAQAESKYRSQVSGAQQHWAAGRAERKFEKGAEALGMTSHQARRKQLDAQAEASNNATLGAAAQADALEVAGDVKLQGSNITLDANAARAIQMGQLQAQRTHKQADASTAESARIAGIQEEMKAELQSTLQSGVDGKGAKSVKSPVTYYETDENGNVISSRVIPQDPMYDQAGGELKKTLEDTPEYAEASPATRKNATELTAARQLAEHAKGKYVDENGQEQNFKLKMKPEVAEVLQKHGMLDKVANSRKAGDLWIDPGSAAYDELRELKDGNGKKMFGVPDGHSLSMLNHHIQNDERAKSTARDLMKSTTARINAEKRND